MLMADPGSAMRDYQADLAVLVRARHRGYGAILLDVFYQIIDVWEWRRWSAVFVWIGTDAKLDRARFLLGASSYY
jgi:hypothetical protein